MSKEKQRKRKQKRRGHAQRTPGVQNSQNLFRGNRTLEQTVPKVETFKIETPKSSVKSAVDKKSILKRVGKIAAGTAAVGAAAYGVKKLTDKARMEKKATLRSMIKAHKASKRAPELAEKARKTQQHIDTLRRQQKAGRTGVEGRIDALHKSMARTNKRSRTVDKIVAKDNAQKGFIRKGIDKLKNSVRTKGYSSKNTAAKVVTPKKNEYKVTTKGVVKDVGKLALYGSAAYGAKKLHDSTKQQEHYNYG